MKEHFRGVIWPKQKTNEVPKDGLYRYVVVGMLVTDKPMGSFDVNEVVVDGNTYGLVDILECVHKLDERTRQNLWFSDANDVLVRLSHIRS